MTDEQWYRELTRVLNPSDPQGTRDAVFNVFRRIRFAEKERCADAAMKLFGHPPLGRKVADAILATSPGKGGG